MLQVRIAMVGKYTGLSDAYLSVLKVSCFIVQRFGNPVSINYHNYLFQCHICVLLIFLPLLPHLPPFQTYSYIYHSSASNLINLEQ